MKNTRQIIKGFINRFSSRRIHELCGAYVSLYNRDGSDMVTNGEKRLIQKLLPH
jgi:hypothetical protein